METIGEKRVAESDSNATSAKKPALNPPVEPSQNVISPKHFVLKHTFINISSMAEGETRFSPIEDHFGLNLCIKIARRDGYLEVHLVERKAPGQWHLHSEMLALILGKKQPGASVRWIMEDHPFHSSWSKLKWDSLSNYLVDDSLTVKHGIWINEMRKIGKKTLRSFDESVKDLSDVVLVVRNQKFYTSKYTLSAHSTYFKSLFLGPYKEANMPEITLNGIDPFDMQNYLEFLYLQPSISEDTVEGLLLLSDQYDTAILKEKCEEFLLKDSKKRLKKKFKMFLKYNCLMEKITNEIRTYNDYKEVMAGEDISQMDPKLMSQLLSKSVSF